MTKVIHKFPITQAWEQTLEVNEGSQIWLKSYIKEKYEYLS